MIFLFKKCKYIILSSIIAIILLFFFLGLFNIITLNILTLLLFFIVLALDILINTTVIPLILVNKVKSAIFKENNLVKYHRLIRQMEVEKWFFKLPLQAESFLVNSNVIYLIYTKKFVEAKEYLNTHYLNIPNDVPKHLIIYFERKSLFCLIEMLSGDIENYLYDYENLLEEIQISNEFYKSNTISLNDIFNICLKIGNEILSKESSEVPNYTLKRIEEYKNVTQMTILYFVNYVIKKGDPRTEKYFQEHCQSLFKEF